LLILVFCLNTQIVDLHHPSMMLSEEIHDVRPAIAVHSFNSLGWKPKCYDSVGNVSEVNVIFTSNKSVFIGANQSLKPKHTEVSIKATSRLCWRLVLNNAFGFRLVVFFLFLALNLLLVGNAKDFIVVCEVELDPNRFLPLLNRLFSLNL